VTRVASSAVVVAVALVLAGCGSASKKDVIARADAICAGTQRDLRALTPPTGSSLSALASYFGQVVLITDNEATQVHKLPRPKQDLAALDRWIQSVQLAAGDFRALASAAKLADRQAFDTALAALRTSDETGLAERYGARVCAASSGTVSSSGS
jgi:hypothetical protein